MPRGRRPGPPQPPPDEEQLLDEGVAPARVRLAVRLGQARFERGLTHQQLAEAAGLNRSIIVGIESGQRDPAFSSLVKLQSFLGLGEWEDLLGPTDVGRNDPGGPPRAW